MNRIAKHLIDHYPPGTFDEDVLVKALDLNQDRVVVIQQGDRIAGVAVFLTLTCESFDRIHDFNYFNADTLASLLKETGPHLHFIMVAAKGVGMILEGAKKAIVEQKAASVSWWDDKGKFHKFRVN